MKITMLGPLEVQDGTESFAPTAPKPRKVLAMLVATPNRSVSTAALTEELWGEHPPASAPTTLQTYIFQLRRALAETSLCFGERQESHHVIETRPNSYRLVVPPECVDAHLFAEAARRGRELLRAREPEAASDVLEAGLALWQGPPLLDVEAGSVLGAQVRHLEETWLCAVEMRNEADLMLGRHRALVDELFALTTRHPLNETLHSQLISALHLSGRRAEALDVYRRVRDTLVEELGLEPGPELQRVHQQVLAPPGDPAPVRPRAA